jgi:hypothetical protein
MVKLVPFPRQSSRLPHRLLRDGWWLTEAPAEKAGVVVSFRRRGAPSDEPPVSCQTGCPHVTN